MPTLEQRTAPTGHMAAQLNVTFCDMSWPWLTRADLPLPVTELTSHTYADPPNLVGLLAGTALLLTHTDLADLRALQGDE